tara:strand:- start:721 stop:1644 length:924 start_codon:yes stop_codon:yes gene_type:complete
MAFKSTRAQFAKIAIGTPDLSKSTITQFASTGMLTNPGISLFGGSVQAGVIRAGVSIGPPLAVPGAALPFSLEVTGVSQYFGILNVFGSINRFGLLTANGGSLKNGFSFKNAFNLKNAIDIGNAVDIKNAPITANGGIIATTVTATTFTGALIGVASGNKVLPFDIPHWEKKGKRIRHVCAEGPEAGIYIRGKLDGSNIIELPEYWQGLVDYDTITVTLTPYGKKDTSLYVKDVSEDRVLVSGDSHTNVKCFYEVWVARWIDPRNHDEKLHVVYDGDSPDDYPGDSQHFLVGGWDYDRRDTKWEVEE